MGMTVIKEEESKSVLGWI